MIDHKATSCLTALDIASCPPIVKQMVAFNEHGHVLVIGFVNNNPIDTIVKTKVVCEVGGGDTVTVSADRNHSSSSTPSDCDCTQLCLRPTSHKMSNNQQRGRIALWYVRCMPHPCGMRCATYFALSGANERSQTPRVPRAARAARRSY